MDSAKTVTTESALRLYDAVAEVMANHIHLTYLYYKGAEDWAAYKTRKDEVKRDMHRQREEYMREKVRGWEAAHGP